MKSRSWGRKAGRMCAAVLAAVCVWGAGPNSVCVWGAGPAAEAAGGGEAFAPEPKEAYARQFVELCQGEQWFLEEVERLLNQEQKTIDTIASRGAFSRITSLGLEGRGIRGKIPAAIGELRELKYLLLGDNHLTGELPAELFTLEKLENVDLSQNQYEGEIPGEFVGLPELKVLLLWGNRYSGPIPAELCGMPQLEVLDLSENVLRGGIPEELGNLDKLRYLSLSRNLLGGRLPKALEGLERLEVFAAWGCGLQGELACARQGEESADPGLWKELKILDLAQNQLTGGIPAGLSGLTELTELNLSDNRLTGRIPDLFGPLRSLREVHLSGNRLRGLAPDSLKTLAEAGETGSRVRINLSSNYLTGGNLLSIERANKDSSAAKNFADGATSPQYRLTTGGYIQIFKDRELDLYPYLRNQPATQSGLPPKPLLTRGEYRAGVYDSTKLALRADSGGIEVRALEDISYKEPQRAELYILDNDGSLFSTAVFTLGTEPPPAGGSGGVGGGGATPAGADPEPTEFHERYLSGYPDGTVRPEGAVTREETAALTAGLMGAGEEVNRASSVSVFSDVEGGRWSLPFIEYVKRKNYMNGDPGGTFRPEDSISREEFAACVVQLAGGSPAAEKPADFPLIDVGDNWAKGYIYAAYEAGYVSGYEDQTFRGSRSVTRAEAVSMLSRAVGRIPDPAAWRESKSPFSDLTPAHWAWLEVLEAAVSHEHRISGADAGTETGTEDGAHNDDGNAQSGKGAQR